MVFSSISLSCDKCTRPFSELRFLGLHSGKPNATVKTLAPNPAPLPPIRNREGGGICADLPTRMDYRSSVSAFKSRSK
jgi:hypothetical protein